MCRKAAINGKRRHSERHDRNLFGHKYLIFPIGIAFFLKRKEEVFRDWEEKN